MEIRIDPRDIDQVRPEPEPAYRSRLVLPASRPLTLDRVIRFVLGLAAVAAAVWVVWYFAALIVYLVVGVLLAYLMRPLVDRLHRMGVGRLPAIGVAFVLVFGLLTVLVTELVPFAGAQLRDLSRQVAFEPAAQVRGVEPESEAEFAALQPGDLIVAVDGRPWDGFSQLQAALRGKATGAPVTLTVQDEAGAERQVVLTSRAPGTEARPAADEGMRYIEGLGLTVREVTVSDVATAIERHLRTVLPLEPGAIVAGVTEALNRVVQEEHLTRLAGSVVGIFTNIFYAVLVIPFVTFFVLKDGPQLRRSVLRVVPNRYFELTLAILEKIEQTIGRYFRALLLQCTSVATLASVLLSLVGLEYAVAVGVFAGVANTIPYFGPVMGFLAGTLVGIVQTGDFSLVPGVILAMGLTKVVDDAFFQPFIFSRAAEAHPLVILFVVLIGAQLAGILGMLVAIPVTTILRVTVSQVLWSLRNYRILKHA